MTTTQQVVADAVLAALRSVDDPEYPGVSIVELGLVEAVRVMDDGRRLEIDLIPTFSGCPALGFIADDVRAALGRLDPTAIRVDDLCQTHMDPFAKDIRKLLKRKYSLDTSQPTGITAVYSIEPRRQPFDLHYDEATGGFMCVCPHGDNEFHSCDHRNQIDGSVAFVTSVFGMQMAGVVVRRLAHGR